MDLQTVKEELLSGNYETPMEFAKDMRLIFQNSRNYNTNQRSRVSLLHFPKAKRFPFFKYFSKQFAFSFFI